MGGDILHCTVYIEWSFVCGTPARSSAGGQQRSLRTRRYGGGQQSSPAGRTSRSHWSPGWPRRPRRRCGSSTCPRPSPCSTRMYPSVGWAFFLCNCGQALMTTWKFNSPTLNADSEFAVTALSEGFSAQVILTWSLQVTALSEGWHRACRFLIFFGGCLLIGGLVCLGHTDLEFAVHCLIQGLTQDRWGWQGS